jgi:hypothetical protein
MNDLSPINEIFNEIRFPNLSAFHLMEHHFQVYDNRPNIQLKSFFLHHPKLVSVSLFIRGPFEPSSALPPDTLPLLREFRGDPVNSLSMCHSTRLITHMSIVLDDDWRLSKTWEDLAGLEAALQAVKGSLTHLEIDQFHNELDRNASENGIVLDSGHEWTNMQEYSLDTYGLIFNACSNLTSVKLRTSTYSVSFPRKYLPFPDFTNQIVCTKEAISPALGRLFTFSD